ncbi:hypothetical protein ACC754_45220, partial [Rhizobium johnstonii]
VRLHESVAAVQRLDEIFELRPDTEEDFPPAGILKILTRPEHLRLAGKLADTAFGKVDVVSVYGAQGLDERETAIVD